MQLLSFKKMFSKKPSAKCSVLSVFTSFLWNLACAPAAVPTAMRMGMYNEELKGQHMMTSSNGNIYALLDICAGNSPVTGEFPTQRPVTRSFYVFFDLRMNKRLSKQWWGWWFETPSRPLWRHCNEHEKEQFISDINEVQRAIIPGKKIKRDTENLMLSLWRNFHYWLHRKLSKWQLKVRQVTTISSKKHFSFSE